MSKLPKNFTVPPGTEPLRLKLDVTVGILGTIAVTRAWASHEGFWENEVLYVGSANPEDLGISGVPTQPGEYVWRGTFKVWGPDVDGNHEGEYQGSWEKIR